MSLLARSDKPYKTSGKAIWWIPDGFVSRNRWNETGIPPILYRDEVRHGVWVPEASLNYEQLKMLEMAAAEDE